MSSFQRPRRRVPWSSRENGSWFFAPTGRSHIPKTKNSRKPGSSSEETFIVKHIRHLLADQAMKSYKQSCPLTKGHSLLSSECVRQAGPGYAYSSTSVELQCLLCSSPLHTLPAFISSTPLSRLKP